MRVLPAAVAVAVAVGTSGCGSEGDGTPPTTDPGTPTSAPSTAEPSIPLGTGSAEGPRTGPDVTTGVPAPGAGGPKPARPCPIDVAPALPDGAGSVLVAAYLTPRFSVRYCRTGAGRLYYHGVSRKEPSHTVTLPAVPVPGGYRAESRSPGTAGGHVYVYTVAGGRLSITLDGRPVRNEPATALR